jgi:hypothetical protein
MCTPCTGPTTKCRGQILVGCVRCHHPHMSCCIFDLLLYCAVQYLLLAPTTPSDLRARQDGCRSTLQGTSTDEIGKWKAS